MRKLPGGTYMPSCAEAKQQFEELKKLEGLYRDLKAQAQTEHADPTTLLNITLNMRSLVLQEYWVETMNCYGG